MTIKHLGGVFGRNPTFYNVTIEGQLIFEGGIDVNSDLTVGGNLDVNGTITADNTLSIENSSGYGTIELGGSSGAFIDLKSPFSDDYDLRLISTGTGGEIDVAAGELTIKRGGSPKLATTSTGVDVTGTVVSDGLTVDGTNAGLSITGPSSQLMKIATTSSLDKIAFAGGDGSVEAMRIDSNGDISFYEDTGTTAKFFWDSSAERLGIGDTSPSNTLTVKSSGDDNGILLKGSGGDTLAWIHQQSTDAATLRLYDGGAVKVLIGSNENADSYFNSGGNLLVGKTGQSFNTAGAEVKNDGQIWATKDGGAALSLNRKTSNGSIAVFYKDGTIVGSIGSYLGDRLFVGTGDTNLNFHETGDSVYPSGASGNTRDDAIDLGASFSRFKDLYLSGGAYLGGTAAANLLDDYEEGLYTVAVTAGTSGTITLDSSQDQAQYTKVGRKVTVSGRVTVSSVSSPTGTLSVSLPFALASLTDNAEIAIGTWGSSGVNYTASNIVDVVAYLGFGSTFQIYQITDNAGWSALDATYVSATDVLAFNITYVAA